MRPPKPFFLIPMTLLDFAFVRSAAASDMLGLLAVKPDEALHRERLDAQERGKACYLVGGDPAHPVLGYGLLLWNGDARHPDQPILCDLLVRPEWRGQGLGTRLLHHAESLCRARGIFTIGLGVNPHDNPRALTLYKRLGYRETGEAPYCDVYAVTDKHGERRLYEDTCLFLIKDLRGEPAP